jgi:hypothetical protein
MIMSSGEDGACTVVSQYGGTASAWAEAYEGGASFWESSGTRYTSSPVKMREGVGKTRKQ